MKSSISILLRELQEACCQSLYNGNNLELVGHASPVSNLNSHNPSKRQHCEKSKSSPRTWEVILSDAAANLSMMTEHEHGKVSRLASILLLGFFLPRSTGNEFFVLQNISSRIHLSQHQSSGTETSEHLPLSSEAIADHIIHMSLEERLASIPHKYCTDNFGELDSSLVEEHLDAALCSFISKALQPLLSVRPAHTRQVDILHIIAMAIHPQPSEQPIRATVAELEQGGSECWARTQKLMSSLVPHTFHVNYRHRLQLVRLVAEHLILPQLHGDQAAIDAPLFEGALPHLRASMYAFSMAAMNPYDFHLTQCGLVSAAIQTRVKEVVNEEWGRLLHRLMDDRNDYNCSHSNVEARGQFCPHRARGQLLEVFLTRFCGARHSADAEFLQHALGSLTDAIEFKVDCWTNENGSDSLATATEPPCILASLLVAATPLFYFLLPISTEDEGSEDSQHRDMLVSCGIQLLHHRSSEISIEASKLLVLAICYGPETIVGDYTTAFVSSIRLAITSALENKDGGADPGASIVSIVATLCRKSPKISKYMMKMLISLDPGGFPDIPLVERFMAVIANSSPTIARNSIDEFKKRLQVKDTSTSARPHLLATLLGCRGGYFFDQPDDDIQSYLEEAVSGALAIPAWDVYMLARQALVSGRFASAAFLCEELTLMSTTDFYFVWLSTIQKVALAESYLLSGGANRIPHTCLQLQSASAELVSLNSLTEHFNVDFRFQRELLTLRVDALDIMGTLRQLASEMRLTSAGPQKFTRPILHLKGAVKLLNVLGAKYLTFYRQHGLFICQQSRTALRTLHAMCRFVASAARSTFIDELHETDMGSFEQNAILALTLPKGDSLHLLTKLMTRFDAQIVQHMGSAVETKIRAEALLQIIDGVLKVPNPFPRSFFRTKSITPTSLKIFLDSDASEDAGEPEEDAEELVEMPTGSLITFYASGTIPAALIDQANLPFHTILIWYSLSVKHDRTKVSTTNNADSSKQDDDNKSAVSESKSNTSSLHMKLAGIESCNKDAPVAASLSPGGTFYAKIECGAILQEEGVYTVSTYLGCRDIRGGEWELPIETESHSTIAVRVTSTRSS